jgi:hypothetical protein
MRRAQLRNLAPLALTLALVFPSRLLANQAQPVPVPEDDSTAPQISFSGVGIGTLSAGRTGDHSAESAVSFTDSSLVLGAAQKLSQVNGVGSFGFGGVTTDQANTGMTDTKTGFFIHKAFADVQTETFETLIGRSDNETAHLIDFPTLRGDDLITLTNPLNPFSNGGNTEEHRYANVASMTFNQSLTYFENVHAQHLINSAGIGSSNGINSVGATFEYRTKPGLEAFGRAPYWGAGVEHIFLDSNTNGGLNQMYAGTVINLIESVTNRFDLRLQDIVSVGSQLMRFQNVTDTYQANSNAITLALRYLNSPFGRPGYQIGLTTGYKNYFDVGDSRTFGTALTGVKRLGQGFDVVAQYEGQWRESALSTAQANGVGNESTVEVGFVFGFDAVFNEHISPRRTLLNQEHKYIPN